MRRREAADAETVPFAVWTQTGPSAQRAPDGCVTPVCTAYREAARTIGTAYFIGSIRLHGGVHFMQRLLAAHTDVAIVFLAHELLKDAHHLVFLMRNQQIDGLGADARIVVGE